MHWSEDSVSAVTAEYPATIVLESSIFCVHLSIEGGIRSNKLTEIKSSGRIFCKKAQLRNKITSYLFPGQDSKIS